MYFIGHMCQVFVFLFYGYIIFSAFLLYFGRYAFRLPEITNHLYPGKIFLSFLFYNQLQSDQSCSINPFMYFYNEITVFVYCQGLACLKSISL